jgi:hypothetical protein
MVVLHSDPLRRWGSVEHQGVRARLLTLLKARADAVGLIAWKVNVDSTICRAHQHATGARRDGAGQKEPPGGVATEPDDHGLGRSRGGFTTKIHLSCEPGQRPLSWSITTASVAAAPVESGGVRVLALRLPVVAGGDHDDEAPTGPGHQVGALLIRPCADRPA